MAKASHEWTHYHAAAAAVAAAIAQRKDETTDGAIAARAYDMADALAAEAWRRAQKPTRMLYESVYDWVNNGPAPSPSDGKHYLRKMLANGFSPEKKFGAAIAQINELPIIELAHFIGYQTDSTPTLPQIRANVIAALCGELA